MDGLYHVVRAFDNPEVIHVDDSIDPIRSTLLISFSRLISFVTCISIQKNHRDMNTIMYELCRKDTVYVESMRAKREADVKKDPKNKLPPVFYTVMDKVKDMLGNDD